MSQEGGTRKSNFRETKFVMGLLAGGANVPSPGTDSDDNPAILFFKKKVLKTFMFCIGV